MKFLAFINVQKPLIYAFTMINLANVAFRSAAFRGRLLPYCQDNVCLKESWTSQKDTVQKKNITLSHITKLYFRNSENETVKPFQKRKNFHLVSF